MEMCQLYFLNAACVPIPLLQIEQRDNSLTETHWPNFSRLGVKRDKILKEKIHHSDKNPNDALS